MSSHTQINKILHSACEFLTLLFTSLFMLSSCTWLYAATSLIRPGATWVDDRGQAIDAHGGSVIQWHGMYFWFGEARALDQGSDKRHINCYASPDLIHWLFRRTVVELADPETLGKRWVLERPKVFVSAQTEKFILYAHLDDARYRAARVAQFASDNIDGEYKYIRSFRPLGKESRDIGQFVDDDGSAYLIFESRPSHGFYIAALSADAMNIEREVSFLPTPLLTPHPARHYKWLSN